MPTTRFLRALSVTVLAAAACTDAAAAGPQRLPDFDQATPSQLVISRSGRLPWPDYRLGFRSAVSNVGQGPLIIDGHRSSASSPTMVVDQLVNTDDGPQALVPDVGRMRFVTARDHRHWHLLGFDRYELRRAGRAAVVVADRKSGFCLGDRYLVIRTLPYAAPDPAYTGRCGLAQPELLSMREGISVGYGDDYKANLEGQYLPLTGLRSGRYVLVHRANSDRRLRELRYDNDAASLLLELNWFAGEPRVQVLRTCPDSARCDRRRAVR
jgi:hypothetical protein